MGTPRKYTEEVLRNNQLDNPRLLCPNCHRQTDNFAGRSRGKFSGHATAIRSLGANS